MNMMEAGKRQIGAGISSPFHRYGFDRLPTQYPVSTWRSHPFCHIRFARPQDAKGHAVEGNCVLSSRRCQAPRHKVMYEMNKSAVNSAA